MKKYFCQFPLCNYTTNNKHLIQIHHIVPKELNGSNNKNNLIYLCPNHHNYIFVQNSNFGIHSINSKEKIEIIQFLFSTAGLILHYKDFNNNQYYYNYKTKSILLI